ncbi:MAG: hypothetical protein OIN86_04490 [Candidatus Methanoperedens sp.]|nr:hypothetical protein [Candidatus Methanoperedens sp.]
MISGYFLLGKYDIDSFIRGLLFWLIVIPVTGTFESSVEQNAYPEDGREEVNN